MSALPEQYLQLAADLMPEGASFSETCAVARAIVSARNEALEEAAKLAEASGRANPMKAPTGDYQTVRNAVWKGLDSTRRTLAQSIARSIRNLKSNAQAEAPATGTNHPD